MDTIHDGNIHFLIPVTFPQLWLYVYSRDSIFVQRISAEKKRSTFAHPSRRKIA
jgi:hypothetical protein